MSYYGGGYTSYASYSSYGASTSYDYSSSYDATSCYATGNYLNNINHYVQEVRYGSYANQCVNWQNTATTVVLWHLMFPAENDSTWQTDGNRRVDITLQIDEAETSLDCFTEGTLAFLEQIGGKIGNDTQEIAITLPNNIRNVGVHFYHGMLAFLIEIYGFADITSKVTIHSPHNEPKDAFKSFIESHELLNVANQQRVAVIKSAVSQTNALHDVNEQVIKENKERGKQYVVMSSFIGIPAILAMLFMIARDESTWIGVGATISIVCAIIFFIGLANTASTHKLQTRTLNSLVDTSSVIEQLDALE